MADSAEATGVKWAAVGGTGTVTSVATSGGLTGGPITGSRHDLHRRRRRHLRQDPERRRQQRSRPRGCNVRRCGRSGARRLAASRPRIDGRPRADRARHKSFDDRHDAGCGGRHLHRHADRANLHRLRYLDQTVRLQARACARAWWRRWRGWCNGRRIGVLRGLRRTGGRLRGRHLRRHGDVHGDGHHRRSRRGGRCRQRQGGAGGTTSFGALLTATGGNGGAGMASGTAVLQ